MNTRLTEMKRLFGTTMMLLWFSSLAAQTPGSETKSYSRLNLNFIAQQPILTEHGVSSLSHHNLYGMGIGYLWGINVTGHQLPLFLEIGPECSYTRRVEEIDYWDHGHRYDYEEIETQMLWVSTPINLAYHFHPTDVITLAPSAGFTAKANLLATVHNNDIKTDLLDEDAHRYQWGWNAGFGIYFNRFYMGIRYAADFTPFMSHSREKERFHTLNFNLGLRF